MTFSDLHSMTVIQLRKFAKENHVILSAGLDKASMIKKIAEELDLQPVPVQQSLLDLPELQEIQPAAESDDLSEENHFSAENDLRPDTFQTEEISEDIAEEIAEELAGGISDLEPEKKPEQSKEDTSSGPRFQAAWHSSDAAARAMPHASYASTGTGRPAWQNTTPSGRPLTPEQRAQPLRHHSFGPRFGPAAVSKTEPAAEPVRPVPADRPARPAGFPLPEHRIGVTGGGGTFGPGAASSASASMQSQKQDTDDASFNTTSLEAQDSSGTPSLEDLLAAGDFEEGGGILELHPDGYGFLRSAFFMPSSKDIYVSMAQIRRFGLRTGDEIRGKIRPQREGDKYSALLYIDTINGMTEEEVSHRPVFDELTPVYPYRRMSLETKDHPELMDMRLIDLIAPLGFGQRGLLLCPPDTGKRELLCHYANAVTANYPDVCVLVLLIDPTPEDVTEFRDSVSCPVLASTFDLAPESHLRLTEMVIERAMRLAEQKKDVVILADSLTKLAKIYSSSAVQQGRSVPGMVNPASLLRAKRMFGAARALKEGGSLTVIAAMDVSSGNKVDDSVVEEFKGTANMELMLDASMAQAGIHPPILLQRSYTKNSDLLLDERQKEGLSLIRQMLGSTSSAVAIPQLVSMMEKTTTNSDLLLKMKDWFALMNM